jgi:hypothetical protein
MPNPVRKHLKSWILDVKVAEFELQLVSYVILARLYNYCLSDAVPLCKLKQ